MKNLSVCFLVVGALISRLMAAMMPQLNISLQDISGASYEMGQTIELNWTSNCSDLSEKNSVLVMIELLNDRPGVMLEPLIIASNLPCMQTSFAWTVPGFLRAAPDYHLRVSQQTPIGNTGSKGVTRGFELKNPVPGRKNTLDLIEPTGSIDGSSYESSCLLGERCWVLWDYPEIKDTAVPELIDIKLYAGDHLALIIAQNVPIVQKNYLWQVPNDSSLSGPLLHVIIMASGKTLPTLTPGSSYYLASSGYPFKLETRVDREKRWASEGKSPAEISSLIEATETGAPTASTLSGFLDVPRPTYSDPSKSSADASKTAKSGLTMILAVTFIGAILLI